MSGLFKFLARRIYDGTLRSVQYFEPRFFPFGLVAVCGFPLYYLIWHNLFPQPYENLLLRLVGSVIFVPVMLAKYWPERLRQYQPAYWYFSVLYALPFFFTFMLLKNNGNTAWLLSALVAAFLMVLLLDWLNLFIQFAVGVGLAWLAYHLTTETPHTVSLTLEYVPVYLFVMVLGAVANYSSEVLKQERLKAMQRAAGTIAHELRTPLLGIKAGAAGLMQHLPVLLEAYRMGRKAGIPVPPLREAHLDSMRGVLERIENEVNHSNVVIDMLLLNTRHFDLSDVVLADCSMAACAEMALQRYPFASEKERSLITLDDGQDFIFRGNELLVVHVLFNLLKNALRQIAKAGKGDILIRLERSPEEGILIFRDTGPGIPPQVLPYIFSWFYSWSLNSEDGSGAGIGLAYCRSVMQSLGGNITCKSTLGAFSEFVLTFPAARD